jgi:AraC-like DNA-binding protein
MSYDYTLLFQRILVSLRDTPTQTLTSLSRQLRVSPRTIEMNIVHQTGKCLRSIRQEVMLDKIKNLLAANPTISIKELALAIGYKSPQSLARSVKRSFGVSPQVLRSNVSRLVSDSKDAHQLEKYLSLPLHHSPVACLAKPLDKGKRLAKESLPTVETRLPIIK